MMNAIRSSLLAATTLFMAPLALSAHAGHGGDHGWLAGAAQPLLSVDHFLAGVFVALMVAVGVAGVARLTRVSNEDRSSVEP